MTTQGTSREATGVQDGAPVLAGFPDHPVGYDRNFAVTTPTPALASSAALVVNGSQRYLELQIVSRAGTRIVLKSPPSTAVVPPGEYMLCLLNGKGVPSEGKPVQLAASV